MRFIYLLLLLLLGGKKSCVLDVTANKKKIKKELCK